MTESKTVISCSNIWKLFGRSPKGYLQGIPDDTPYEKIVEDGYIAAVRQVSLDITEGEMIVIMGLSGSGKSTLVRCFARLLDITKGSIWVDGEDIGKMSENQLIQLRRKKMGMVFQNFGLLPHRTVLNNVAFPLEMRGQGVHERHERAMEMIDLVGLGGREDYYPRELSGGQQQRVGIARSLAIEPDIWFLDEPFSALDPLIRREMQDEFLRLQGMLNKTIVFITHDFDEALRLADRIAIMKDGAIEQCNTPDQIVLKPATEYVSKFTLEIEKARVVHARGMLQATRDPEGSIANFSISGEKTIQELARILVNEEFEFYPVEDSDGQNLGFLNRQEALELLIGPNNAG
ncbi:MAG: betaine/proline/choline family ABC transporter ATP-binding protein [Paracoccaceae bacterium]|nr:betaine/proline/choline family ABC transporter ATP-binding protein [Paracoccaceae bacterium]MDE2916303.1 betaine/proline/choline family ABC transporter ATP-binding protein [Paracoccaceae bacterium]